jgi:type II secretory ATPase GspE/PulE/Tfp pilus assembly ATPase PilB-like protein
MTCADCKVPVTYPEETLAKVGLAADPDIVFYKGQGCEQCSGTGYRGRTGAFEILVVDATINALIRERADSRRIKQAAVSAGMNTLLGDALAKAIFGQTTIEEVIRVAYE